MIRGFAAKGYEVDLIVSKVHKDLLCQGDIKPFEVPSSTNTIILPDRNAKNNVRAIRNYLIDNTPDAIVAMSTNYNFALALASLYLPRRIKKKCRIAYVEHSGLVGLDKSGKQSKSPRLLSKARIISFVFNHVYDVIMGVSEGTSHGVETTMHRKHGSVLTVYNPAIDELYWKKLKSPTTNNWLKDKTIPTLVAAGAHSPIKNHLCLFEAIKLANQKTPVRLVLFGKGNLTNSYKLWIKENGMADRIMLAGHTSNLPAELKKPTHLLFPPIWKVFPLYLLKLWLPELQLFQQNVHTVHQRYCKMGNTAFSFQSTIHRLLLMP